MTRASMPYPSLRNFPIYVTRNYWGCKRLRWPKRELLSMAVARDGRATGPLFQSARTWPLNRQSVYTAAVARDDPHRLCGNLFLY